MSTILDQILADKARQVGQAKIDVPVEELQRRIPTVDRPRNFYAAIAKHPLRRVNLIAEIKKASPSAGIIREDFDVQQIAKIYSEAGADAISVLTDEKYFQGRLEHIQQVKQVTRLPVLRKDFIVDEYQIYEARAHGADAVLLIADALNESQLLDMLILASTLKMTSLIEVHSPESLLAVRRTVGFPHERYSLLGVNNRDLTSQKTDVGHTVRMLDMIEDDIKDVIVSESGIHTAEHVEKLVQAGVRGILVGESLMKSDDIAAKITELLGPIPQQD